MTATISTYEEPCPVCEKMTNLKMNINEVFCVDCWHDIGAVNRAYISVFTPSRNNPRGLKKMLRSLDDTSTTGKVEVLVKIDNDDTDTLKAFNQVFPYLRNIKAHKFIGPQPENLTRDYNHLAKRAEGKLLMVLNDDAWMKTKGWDYLAIKAHYRQMGEAVLFDIWDSTRDWQGNGEFPCFPMITREAYEALGYFFHGSVRGWSADRVLSSIYRPSGAIVFLHDIVIQHDRKVSGDNYDNMVIRYIRDQIEVGLSQTVDVKEDVYKLIACRKK